MKIDPPAFIYGTAWKEANTARLVQLALSAGFRALDTANQPRHYNEAQVGEALLTLGAEGVGRAAYFLQSKFTPLDSQDKRVPYDPAADVATQVRQSFASSLEHLHTDYLDAYLLHGPTASQGLSDTDWEVWEAIEAIHQAGQAKLIGISNVSSEQLECLVEQATIKPMIVQNRCYASQGWDREVRELCRHNGISYQGFSLLTANKTVLQDQRVKDIAERLHVTLEQVVFRFATQVGMVPLTGTRDDRHMKQDLEIFEGKSLMA